MSVAPQNLTGKILIVEDDADFAASIEMVLGTSGEGHGIEICHDGAEALQRAKSGDFDLVLTDFRLPGMGGLELLNQLRKNQPMRPVILMTGNGNTELAIEATKQGAYDYLLKPFDLDNLIDVTSKAISASRAMRLRVKMGSPSESGEPSLIGNCPAMQTVYKEIGRIAPTHITALILGETGTGKELVATAIYQHSERSTQPFVAVNCGAIPENLLESELFGHVRGAFTGATADRIGRFQQANGGTLFLDEIGDLPLPVQVKLLRVLQEGKIQPLGSSREQTIDVRIIAATHQPLKKLIAKGEFREDLYYRINSAIIQLPPLKERGKDLQELIHHFAKDAAAQFQLPQPALSSQILKRLASHPWPGNVRELKNIIGQIVLRSRGYGVSLELIESALKGGADATTSAPESSDDELDFSFIIKSPVRSAIEEEKATSRGNLHERMVTDLERELISGALELSSGHLGKVCAWLGISRVTLRKKMAIFSLGGR